MSEVWSLNTTLRNPERLESMLRTLSELEGENFDEAGQEKFFGLQIKKRLYKPTKSSLSSTDLIDIVHNDITGDDIEDKNVERILEIRRGTSADGALRGRTSVGALNRFGLCIALKSHGPVVISKLGKEWLAGDISDEELFLKFFIKWQYPNPIESGYDDFNIKPFLGVLKVIDAVNDKWKSLGNKPVGISKDEYAFFLLPLSKKIDIPNTIESIINFRSAKEQKTGREKKDYIDAYKIKRGREIFGDKSNLSTKISNLSDYTDSSVRYFRMTGLISLRGNNNYIDISRDKQVQVKSLIENIDSASENFQDYNSYFEYLNNQSLPTLPWETEEYLAKISDNLLEVIAEESGGAISNSEITQLEKLPSGQKVEELRSKLNTVRTDKLKSLKHNVAELRECIDKLNEITKKNYKTLTTRPSLDFEWYVSRSLMILNDAVEIRPSYKLGDDGLPTGFRANVSDIECFYATFGMTIEVTLMLGRDQWHAEGQPVMRHYRDFEDKSEHSENYCLFIAPILHRDTINSFWVSNKYEFEGKKQNIIPLTLDQYVNFLEVALTKIENNQLDHLTLKSLLSSITGKVEQSSAWSDWLNLFPTLLRTW